MLQSLTIKNYALIDNVSMSFSPGFTIITGETGAGKSIMLGALSLLLGERAETKAISDKTRKSVIEAVFTKPDPELLPIFEEQGLEWNPEEILVRREVSPNGRSRAFINDSPVTLPVLTAVTANLVDIHSQNSNLLLSQSASHLQIIDAFSGNGSQLAEYRADFGRYVTLRAKIRKIKERNEKNRENREFIAFQLEQLDKINPKEGELKQVEQEFDMLSDADQIREDLGQCYNLLDGSDLGVVSQLSEAEGYLSRVNLTLFDENDDAELLKRMESARIELKDISETVRDYLDRVGSDPNRLARVTARMNQLYDAIKRFKTEDEDGLIKLRRDLRHKLNAIDFGDDNVAELEKEAKRLAKILKGKADELTERRKEAAAAFAEALLVTAQPLGMPNLRFEVELTQGKLTADGQDTAEFMCSFNKNHPIQPMARVASGGETARLMLSIKSIMARCMHLPTVIFDEVDTGVSGEIADKMGSMMRTMGSEMQVLAITHLPQVAAKGGSHFKVYKTDEEERTVSHVRLLSIEERIGELAGMLSGSEVNDAARMNAKVLLGLTLN